MIRITSSRLRASLAAFALMVSASIPVGPAMAQTAAAPEATATPSTAAPAAAPAAVAAATAAAPVENPYGLEALWKGSDAVAKTVLVILVIMSMGSWYILIVKVIEQSKIKRQAKLAAKSFWISGSVRQGADTLDAASPFRFIAEAGLDATRKHDGLLEHVDLNSWVTMTIQRSMERVQSRLQDGLAFLATVGSTAPFVGLFGTVWGIYHALTAIGVAGQASIDKVAGPVGEALIMTAIGLAVAVPAVLGYNWLVRRNKGSMDEVRAFGNDLYAVLLSTTASTTAKRGLSMGMNVGSADGGDEDRVVSEINTTPLVDVMLVLLIIFLITIPVVTTSIPVQLPKETIQVRESKPENIIISADPTGGIYWYDAKVASTQALVDKLKKVAVMKPQPEVQIRGDFAARYEAVGRIVYACQRAGIAKVSFITEPPARGG